MPRYFVQDVAARASAELERQADAILTEADAREAAHCDSPKAINAEKALLACLLEADSDPADELPPQIILSCELETSAVDGGKPESETDVLQSIISGRPDIALGDGCESDDAWNVDGVRRQGDESDHIFDQLETFESGQSERGTRDEHRIVRERATMSVHRRQALEAKLKGLGAAIRRATCPRSKALYVAEFKATANLLNKPCAASLLREVVGTNDRHAQRMTKRGAQLWADIMRVSLNMNVAPDMVFELLGHLSPAEQLRVAQLAEWQREFWQVEDEVNRTKRLPKLTHGVLTKLPLRYHTPAFFERLALMKLTDQEKEVADLIIAERRKERNAQQADARRAQLIDKRNTGASSRLLQLFSAATKADKDEFLQAVGLQQVEAA